MLCQKGVARDKAACELRRVVHGRKSRYLLERGFGFGVFAT
jgi:hypothetical protein